MPPSIVLWWRWTWGVLSESGHSLAVKLGNLITVKGGHVLPTTPRTLVRRVPFALGRWSRLGGRVSGVNISTPKSTGPFRRACTGDLSTKICVCGLSLCWIWTWTSWKGYCNTKVTLVSASFTSRTVSDAREVQLSQVTAHFGTHQCSSSGMGYRHRQFQRIIIVFFLKILFGGAFC